MKIALAHYRIGRTDGVSLEMEKHAKVLRSLGHKVQVISGPVNEGSDNVIRQLEFDTPRILEIKENTFKFFGKRSLRVPELMDRIRSVATKIERGISACHRRGRFDLLMLHNIFSHGRHIAAAAAFMNAATKLHLPAVAINHDYYWERNEYMGLRGTTVQRFLDTYVPPKSPRITHVSINSLAQATLRRRRNIRSELLPNVMDFGAPSWRKDKFNSDLPKQLRLNPNDLVVLQATRIVERKGIELAIELTRQLATVQQHLVGKYLYNGKKITSKSRVVLVLAGYVETSARPYLARLKRLIKSCGIEARFAGHLVGGHRKSGRNKRYALGDMYAHSDLVTYPSLQEGWGNQFIEAVFAHKPVVLFEYPVFRADIKKEGYQYVSLGSRTLKRNDGLVSLSARKLHTSAHEVIEILTGNQTPGWLDSNRVIGRKYHDVRVLKNFFARELRKFM